MNCKKHIVDEGVFLTICDLIFVHMEQKALPTLNTFDFQRVVNSSE